MFQMQDKMILCDGAVVDMNCYEKVSTNQKSVSSMIANQKALKPKLNPTMYDIPSGFAPFK